MFMTHICKCEKLELLILTIVYIHVLNNRGEVLTIQ